MKQRIFLVAAFSLLAIATGDAAAQTAQMTPAIRGLPSQTRPDPATIARVDPVKALQDQIAELKAQVAALKQANDALAAKVQTLDSGLGQVVIQNVTQAKQINDLSSQLSGVSTKLATHRHSYKYEHVEFMNTHFVTEVGGIGSADKKDLASYINGEPLLSGTTGPAE
jgi:hypothetical protein